MIDKWIAEYIGLLIDDSAPTICWLTIHRRFVDTLNYWLLILGINWPGNQLRALNYTGSKIHTLFEEWLGIFYLHYYIDIVAHTMAFDTPVVGHWLGKSLTQQYTLNLFQLWDNQGWMPRPGIEPGSPAQETNVLPTELTPPPQWRHWLLIHYRHLCNHARC